MVTSIYSFNNSEKMIVLSTIIVQRLTGITDAMVKDEEPLSMVLPKFFSWLSETTQEVSKSTKLHPGKDSCDTVEDVMCHHYHESAFTAVLVAHNGYEFDFPLLLEEMKRTPQLSTSTLAELNIFFADTLSFLREVSNYYHY